MCLSIQVTAHFVRLLIRWSDTDTLNSVTTPIRIWSGTLNHRFENAPPSRAARSSDQRPPTMAASFNLESLNVAPSGRHPPRAGRATDCVPTSNNHGRQIESAQSRTSPRPSAPRRCQVEPRIARKHDHRLSSRTSTSTISVNSESDTIAALRSTRPLASPNPNCGPKPFQRSIPLVKAANPNATSRKRGVP